MGRGLRVLGGFLQGLGTGVTNQANASREQALKQMELDAADRRQAALLQSEETTHALDRAHATDLSDAQIKSAQTIDTKNLSAADQRTQEEIAGRVKVQGLENEGRRGLLKTLFTDDQGNTYPVSEGGVKGALLGKTTPKDITPDEKLAVDAAMTANTVQDIDPDSGKVTKSINQDGVAALLQKHPNPRVQAIGKMFAAGQMPTGMDVDPDAPGSATVTPDGATKQATAPRGLTPPVGAAGNGDIDLKAKADQIKQDYTDNKISKDKANQLLNELYNQ